MKIFEKVLFKIIYIILLILFSVYILLDTFVIEKSEVSNISSTSNAKLNSSSNIIEQPTDYTATSDSYSDENITITIKTITKYNTKVYIADVQVNSIDYLQTAFANNTYGRNIKQTTSSMATSNDAILAINGDFYGYRNSGFVLRNGVVYRNTVNSSGTDEDLVINSDGSFSIAKESTSNINTLLSNGALQVLSFGPALVQNTSVCVSQNTEVAQSKASNPRTAIGEISPLHYIFVVSDGRTSESAGLSLYELASVMKEYGCEIAYNLDGGGSSTMWFNGKVINNPTDGMKSGERSVSDIVYIGY